MSDFVHLHLHSEYSLLDGACRIREIPLRAKACGHSAVALTDHGVLYGAVAFYDACRAAGVKPIIGCEVYVAPRTRFDKTTSDAHPYHLVLLCENETGYRNLLTLVSLAFTEGFYSKPRVDMELLFRYHEGLIALSACLAGQIPRALVAGDAKEAERAARALSDIFGPDHFYIELQNHGLPEESQILPMLVSLSRALGLPMVATNDCHYLEKKDAETQAVLLAIQTNTRLSDGPAIGFETEEFYYKTTEEMTSLFSAYPEAIENSARIAERCRFDFRFGEIHLPKFPVPAGQSAESYLRTLTLLGFKRRETAGELDFIHHEERVYRERMEYELSVIGSMGYDDYFLIVQDYVGFAKSKEIPVGPGRGSGAGSLVAYLLGITDVDPIRFDLLFERFLNPERISMPDIDVDFCYIRRDEVIDYVSRRYGRDHVSQIVTFGTLASRAAVRDVGRVLGMPYSEVDAVAKAIPRELNITVREALKTPALERMYRENGEIRRLLDLSMALEGMPRNASIHAAGVLITERPLSEYVPLSESNGVVVAQYDMDTLARLGLLKFDFLGLRYLTIIDDAVREVRGERPDFDMEKLPLDDSETYRLIASGNTGGVFQLESAGMRQMLMNLGPDSFSDIVAAIALYRPGPMDSIPKFIENRKHPENIRYEIKELAPILNSTYGCVLYQEQVMEIFRNLSGYTFGHADVVRRAMSKKKADVMAAEREGFLSGCVAHGIDRMAAGKLFDELSAFANYAFNKSHAAAYAVLSYRTAYLKCHMPKAFFAALLTAELGNAQKIAEYIAEAGRRKIRVLPPDINESDVSFHVCGDHIRFGLLAVKNVGRTFLQDVIEERKRGGAYRSFEDFAGRLPGRDLNRRQLESLIKVGAFDSLGRHRSQLMAVLDPLLEHLQSRNRANLTGQLDMFSQPGADAPDIRYPDIPEYDKKTLLTAEKEVAGLYFSGHILDQYMAALADPSLLEIRSVYEKDQNGEYCHSDREKVRVAGIVSGLTVKTTKNNEKMAFFTLEDYFGEIECLLFPRLFAEYEGKIRNEEVLCVEGTLSFKEEENPKLTVTAMAPLCTDLEIGTNGQPRVEPAPQNDLPVNPHNDLKQNNPAPASSGSWKETELQSVKNAVSMPSAPRILYLRVPALSHPITEKLKNFLAIFEGNLPVRIYDTEHAAYHTFSGGFLADDFTVSELVKMLGKENVVLK